MAHFEYKNNAIRNQKNSNQSIANINVADNGMIALTEEPLPS